MPIVLALLSSVMWGVADFMGGNSTKRLHVSLVTATSQAFGLITVVVYACIVGWEWSAAAVPWAITASISGYIWLMAFYQALSTGRMGIVSPIAALGALVPLFAGLLQGEKPSSVQVIGIVLAIVGIVMASGPELNGDADLKPVLLAILTACGFGVCLWAIARGGEHSVVTTMVWMRCQTVAVAVLVVLRRKSFVRLTRFETSRLAINGALDVMANVTFAIAAAAGALAIVSVLGSLYPVTTVVLAWWILRERLMPVQYVGVVSALAGVAAISAG